MTRSRNALLAALALATLWPAAAPAESALDLVPADASAALAARSLKGLRERFRDFAGRHDLAPDAAAHAAGWFDSLEESLAQSRLEAARALARAGDARGAEAALGQVVREYPGTRAAAAAGRELNGDAEQRTAAFKLTLARDLLAAGVRDAAADRLRAIVRRFPDTRAAEEARAELERLRK